MRGLPVNPCNSCVLQHIKAPRTVLKKSIIDARTNEKARAFYDHLSNTATENAS